MAALTKNRDIVRLEIGDTDEDEFLLTDIELDAYLTRYGLTGTGTGADPSFLLTAAADAAGAIAASYGRQFSFSEDGQRFETSQRVGHYQALERLLRNRAGPMSVRLSTGGTTTL